MELSELNDFNDHLLLLWTVFLLNRNILSPGWKKLSFSGPRSEVIKLFSCSAQLRLKSILIILKCQQLTFISRINYYVIILMPEFSTEFDYFSIYELLKFHAQLS